MAGKIKNAALATGKTVLGTLKLLVLAFWVGGGLVVGWLASVFLERLFTEKELPDKAGEIAAAILSSFSTMEVIAGAVLCVLLFIFERKSRRGMATLIGFAVLVVLTAVNQFILSGLQGYGIHSTIYRAVFYSEIAIALVFLSVIALAGKAPAAPASVPVEPVLVRPAMVPTAQAVRPPPEQAELPPPSPEAPEPEAPPAPPEATPGPAGGGEERG